jgi:hypothetical protein
MSIKEIVDFTIMYDKLSSLDPTYVDKKKYLKIELGNDQLESIKQSCLDGKKIMLEFDPNLVNPSYIEYLFEFKL